MRQRFYLNGVEINEPDNYQETSIDLNYSDDSIKEAVTVNEWEIGVGDQGSGADGLEILKAYLRKGLTGGPGVTEGIPFKIKLDNEISAHETIFDGYLDLWSSKVESNRIIASAVEQGKLDWLNQVADSRSFEYLFETGVIRTSDFKAIPYVIKRKQNSLEIIMTIVTLYMMERQLRTAINYLLDTINDYDVIYISMIIRVIAQIIQIIVLLAAMVKLSIDLFNMIIHPVKYHYGMYVKEQLEFGLSAFGLKFKSSILETAPFNKLFLLPEKYNLEENNTGIFDGVTGILKPKKIDKRGFYRGTIGGLLRLVKSWFNAKLVVNGETCYLERQDWNPSSSANYELPPYESTGYRYNQDEFKSNIVLKFQTDINDRNTIQEYTGNAIQIISTPKVINNQKMVLTRNFEEVNFGVALGRRKTELNWVEKRLEVFNRLIYASSLVLLRTIDNVKKTMENVVKATNKFIKALKVIGISPKFNLKVPALPGGVESYIRRLGQKFDGTRIGMLKMESDFVNVPKLLLVNFSNHDRRRTLDPNSDTYLSAQYLWENFHFHKSFVPDSQGRHNQYVIEDFPEIPFTFDDYIKVKNSNVVKTIDGEDGKILSLKYNPDAQTASGTVKIKRLYTNNLKENIIIPDGK